MNMLEKTATPLHLYFLSLLDFDNINLDKSFIGDDGMVYLRLKSRKLLMPDTPLTDGTGYDSALKGEKVLEELYLTTFLINQERLDERYYDIQPTDRYYIQFDPELEKVQSFTIEYDGELYSRTHEYLRDTVYFMEVLKHPEFSKYKELYDEFNQNAMWWATGQLSDSLGELKGDYWKETIKGGTYYQVRNDGNRYIYYIVHRWWEKINTEIIWIDVLNDGTMLVALNE